MAQGVVGQVMVPAVSGVEGPQEEDCIEGNEGTGTTRAYWICFIVNIRTESRMYRRQRRDELPLQAVAEGWV